MAQAFTCPNCSAPLDYGGQDLTVRCPYCNSSVIVPDSLRTGSSGPVPSSRQPSLPVVGLDSLSSQAMQLKEVAQHIRSGNKIQAIKVYREVFNVGLAEAKDAVEALAAGRPIVMPGSAGFTTTQSSFSPGGGGASSDPLEDRVAQLLKGGNKIEAIKAYREAYGSGLKEAKDAVDTYERGFPLPKPSTPFQPYAGSQPAIPTFNSGTAPTYTATTSGTYSNRQKGGSFIGTWFGWSFGAFWVGFIAAMLSLFAFPGVLRLAAPVFCPADYVDAYGQRVFNYYDADTSTSVDGAGILICVSPGGSVTSIHPLLTFGFMFIVPWMLGIGVALWLAIFRNVMVLGCLAAGAETAAILVGIVVLNFNIPAASSQTIPMFLFGPEAVSGNNFTTTTTTTTITSTQTFTFGMSTPTPSFAPQVLVIGGEEGTGPGQFNDTRAIAVDDDGNIYVADYSDGRIQVFAEDGIFLSMFDIEDENVYISGIAAGEDGTLYVIYGGDLHIYNGLSGEELPGFAAQESFTSYDDVAVSSNGEVVIASPDDIFVFGPDGTQKLRVPDWGSDLSTQGFPSLRVDNLAVDRNGNIYIANNTENQIFKFSPEGAFMDRIGVAGDGPGEFDGLRAVAVDSENRIYAVDYDGVNVFNARGAFLGLIEIEVLSFDIAVHEDRLYVMDRNANKILIYEQP